MSAADPKVRELSAQDRQKLDELLGAFHHTWEPGRLDHTLAELPVDLPYRLAAVTGLAAIELEMQWQRGNRVPVEDYLARYPELGTVDNVSVELVLAEFLAQERTDSPPDLNAFLARFPQQADEVRRLIQLARSPRMSGLRNRSSTSGSLSGHPTDDAPALPEQFERYRILKKLGQGGMGTVYLAYDTRLDRKVALKVPRFAPGSDHENLERFYREARATATITHPNLCPLYDVGEINGTPYLTMAFIEGWPLSKFIRPDKLLPQFGVATVVRIVAQAIEEAHKRGVIHRDLKPGNIMINKRGEPIVMDFGLARWVNADKEDVRLTRSGAILGAPVYMSPEQVYGDVEAMGPGCDVYSLGVILYELLTGRLPFEGPTTAVLAKTLIQAPKPPSAYRPDVDPRLEAICLKAMAKKITDRYATMAEFGAALTEYIRAERQAQTLTSLSMTKMPSGGSTPNLGGPRSGPLPNPDPSSSSGVNSREATTNTVSVSANATKTVIEEDADATEVIDVADVQLPSRPRMTVAKQGNGQVILWAVLAGGGALAAGLLLIAVVGWMLWPVAPSSTTPAANEGSLHIALSEMPADVEVRVGGEVIERGKLGSPLTLKPGDYQVEVHSGKFEPWTQTIRIERGANPRLEVTLRARETVEVKAKEPQPGLPFQGHDGPVKAVAWSSDGRAILSGSDDFSMRLWDAGTREVKQQFKAHTQPVTSVALSKDGTRALSGGGDGLVILWNVSTGKVSKKLPGHTDWVRAVAISPDGKWGLSGGDDKMVRLWDLDRGEQLRMYPGHTATVWSVAFTPDSKRAASGGEDRTIRLWNLDSQSDGKELTGHFAGVRGLAFLPDGRLLSASDDRTLGLWDTTTGAMLKRYTGHMGKVRGVAVSSDGKRAASAGFGDGDNTVRVWDVDKATLIHSLGSTPQGNHAVAFSPNDRWVIAGGEDRLIRLWDALKSSPETPPAPERILEVRRFGAPKHGIDRVAVSKDGRYALSGGYDGTARWWDLAQGRELRVIQAHTGVVHYVAFSPDDRQALTCGDDKLACLWNLETGELVQKYEGHTDKVWGAIFSTDGTRVVTCAGDKDRTARLWDTATGTMLKKYEGHMKDVNAVALSPDGKRLVTAGWDTTLRVWDVETAKQLHSFKGSGNFSTAWFFPDGRRVVAGNGRKVRLFDVIDFKELTANLQDDPHKDGSVWIVALSPNGRRLLSAGGEKTINLWDVETGKVVQQYTGHTDHVPGVAFTPDGTRFLSGSKDMTLRLWDVPRHLVDPPPLPSSQETTKETQLLQAPTQPPVYVEQVSFTADGKRALWSGNDKLVHVWNLADRKETARFTEHTEGVRAFALLPDRKRVLSSSYDGTLRLWEINTGKEQYVILGNGKKVQNVAVSSTGKFAVYVGEDKAVHLLDFDQATEFKKFEGHENALFAVVLTPDDREAITAGMDKTIRRWDVATGTEIATWKTADNVHTLALSPDGKRVLSGGKDKLVHLWDRENGQLLANFVGHTAIVTCVRFSPDGRWALSSSDDKTMRLWNIETGQEMGRFTGHKQSVKGLAWSPDARQALSCSSDGSVRLWTLPPFTAPIPVDSLKTYTTPDKIDRVAISPDGRLALSAGIDGKVRMFDVESGMEVKSYDWHKESVRYVSFSPDGKWAASGSNDKTAVVWNVEDGTLVRRIGGFKGTVWGTVFSPEGKRLLTSCDDGTAAIWDIETGAAVKAFPPHAKRCNAAAWTPDCTKIVTAGIDNVAKLWDVATGKELRRYEGHTGGVSTVAVSPNGRFVVTGSFDKSVRLWDLESAQLLHIFDGHTNQVWNVAFSPDSHRILSGGSDKTMKLWDVDRRVLLKSYERHNKQTGGVTGVAFHPDGRRALSGSQDNTMRLWGLPVN